MRLFVVAAALALSLATPVFAQSTTAPAATTPAPAAAVATSGHFTTTETPLGDMLDNPDAHTVLVAHIPDMVNNPQIDMARGMTLKSLQSYAPNLTDDALASIDRDLAALPAH